MSLLHSMLTFIVKNTLRLITGFLVLFILLVCFIKIANMPLSSGQYVLLGLIVTMAYTIGYVALYPFTNRSKHGK